VPPAPPRGGGDPVAYRIHDPCGSLGRDPGANRNWPGGLRSTPSPVLTSATARCRGVDGSASFPKRAAPSGINPRLLDSALHRFHGFRPPAVPNRAAFADDFRGITGTAGFRRRAVRSRSRPGVNRFGRFDTLRRIRISASRPEALCRRIAFALPRPGCSALRPFRAARTDGPAVRGNFRSHFQRTASNLRSGEPLLGVGTALHCRPLRATTEQETVRSSPAGRFVRSGFRPASPFGNVRRAVAG